MNDPLECDPDQKAALEGRNGVAQLDYLSELVNIYKIRDIRIPHVLQLHQLAIQDIYPCGGHYRDARRTVHIPGSGHRVPEPAMVPGLMTELVDRLNDRAVPPLERAALALWRFNWIHPFNGGNGRTARALTYLVLCVDFATMIPGNPTFPSIIYERRNEYVDALRHADAGTRTATGEPDLGPMCELVRDAITRQMANALASLGPV